MGFDATYSSFEIQLATFSQPIETLPRQYFSGSYIDSTTVFFRQELHLTENSSPSAVIPAPFDIQIHFDQPFSYNPMAGNLLMYLHTVTLRAGTEVRVDADDSLIPPVGYGSTGVVGGPAFGPSSGAVVAQFDYSQIPEPSSLTLSITWGCIILVMYVARRRNS